MAEHVCGFCGQPKSEVGNLVEGSGYGSDNHVYICSSCSSHVSEAFLREEKKQKSTKMKIKEIPSPKDLSAHLDEYVIGQTRAKKVLSVQVHNHYRRLLDNSVKFKGDDSLVDVQIEKSNILLIGPTGCGKTLLAKSLAKKLNVPFAIGDATTLTEAGYVGEDVENLLLKLLYEADFDIEVAQRGIIYVDEIDKIGKTGGNVSITRDVSGEGVQQSLLKMIEGTVANIPPQGGRKHPEQNYIQMDTSNILFICGGAFVGLDDIIGKRLNQRHIGFGKVENDREEEKNKLLKQVTHEDLVHYGLIPELSGRLPVLASLEELSEDDLIKVLTEPKNALIKQHQKNMYYGNVGLNFTEDAVKEIATKAKKLGTGARALRSIVEEIMLDVYFEHSSHKNHRFITIDGAVVRGEKQVEVLNSAA